MGLGPSLYIACYHFAGNCKTNFWCSAYTKLAEPMESFQFRVGGFNPRTDFIPVFPFSSLLIGIHLIPQSKFGGDLQAKITDCVARFAASTAMIESSHWTLIEHFTGSANVSIENRMQRMARFVIATEDAVVYRAMTHGAIGCKTL